jgi:Protein of unknown function (DUF2637)
MSADTASTNSSRPGPAQADRAPGALRVLAIAAVCVGLAALAGGTFILSYSGIHALALQAGIRPRLARGYPLLIDAMLVVVLAAVLALRGAGLPSRLLAWTTLLAVLAAAAGADALHAAGHRLPDHVAEITAAVLPWVLVFLAFALLLAMLRHARLRRQAAPALLFAPDAGTGPSIPVVRPVLTAAHQPEPSPAVIAIAAPASPEVEQPELAIDTEPGPDDPTSDEAVAEPAGGTDRDQAVQADQTDEPAAQADAAADQDEADDPGMPVFHRMWSSPTPPEPLA